MPKDTDLATNNCLNSRSTEHSEQSYPAHTVIYLCLFVQIFHSCRSTIGRDSNTVPRGRGKDIVHEMFEAVASRNNDDSMLATDSVTKHLLKVDCY